MLKINKKYFIYLLLLLFLAFFAFNNSGQFLNYYKSNIEIKKEDKIIDSGLENFSLDKIRNLDDSEFYYTPYKPLKNKIIDYINTSTKRVYVEVYIFTDKSIISSIIKAKERGIDVKVILEKNPYKAPRLNDKTYNSLLEKGIDVVWSNSLNYSFNHTKMMIIDDNLILSTGNLSNSNFSHNRDMFIFTKDKLVLNTLEKIFIADFDGKKISFYDDNLIISPSYSRDKFELLFLEAKKSIKMHFQYLKDDDLIDLLKKKIKNGVSVKVIVSDSFDDIDVDYLKKEGFEIKIMKKNKMHSKAILVDDSYLFIGSINFSKNSLNNNREIGLLLTNYDIIEKYIELFENDFSN